ncbi:MAG: thioredoxin family protein [Planctomycetota bacterium]
MLIETLALCALATAPGSDLVWHDGALSNAVGKARAEEKMVLVYFWMDGSEYCKELWDNTLTTDVGQEVLGDFVLYSAKHGTAQGGALFERFGVQTLPTMLFLASDGAPEDLIGGLISPEELVVESERIRRGENTVSDLRRIAASHTEKDEAAFEARFALADRLRALGQADEADEVFDSIRTDDPKGKTKLGAKVHLEHAFRAAAALGGGDGNPSGWNLEPVKKHLKKVSFDEVRFEGWTRLANVEAMRSDVAAAADCFGEAWKLCPEDQVYGWAGDVAAFLVQADGERTKREAKLALTLAKASVDAADKLTCEAKDEGCGCDVCTSPEALVARSMSTLARAYRLNGDERRAVKVAKQCAELDPQGGYQSLVEELQGKG